MHTDDIANAGIDRRNAILQRMEKELKAFEAEQRRALGLDAPGTNWHDPKPPAFRRDQRNATTILFGGLTEMHDAFIEAGIGALGYRTKALPCPDNASLQLGKEFGNRAQCNPTYYTVGNLLKYLTRLRDADGMSLAEIARGYVFCTVGGCGPCRFGTYVTEYRKVLRDAGFEGFRVYDLRRMAESGQPSDMDGIAVDARFAFNFVRALIAADVLNMLGYRTRPYEVTPGATDKALQACKSIVQAAFARRHSIAVALLRCRSIFRQVEVNRLQLKPKVALIGEFWAMTTEGEGNYQLQRFLESEGAECEVQLLSGWLLYELWCVRHDTRQRMLLRRSHNDIGRNDSNAPVKTLVGLWLTRRLIQACFGLYARAIGLKHYRLPDIDEMSDRSHALYPNELRGGEGNLEVGKLIEAAVKRKAHMVVSVKPFGCMPSSGVSDGVQSLVVGRFPETNFCPVETSGDGAVSVYSRVQMALFKAHAKAQAELEKVLSAAGTTLSEVERKASNKRRQRSPLHYPRHVVAGTAANAVYEVTGADSESAAIHPPS